MSSLPLAKPLHEFISRMHVKNRIKTSLQGKPHLPGENTLKSVTQCCSLPGSFRALAAISGDFADPKFGALEGVSEQKCTGKNDGDSGIYVSARV